MKGHNLATTVKARGATVLEPATQAIDTNGRSVDSRWLAPTLTLLFIMALVAGGLSMAASPAMGASGDPDLEVYAPENTLTPGSEAELTLVVSNEARLSWGTVDERDRVTRARNVRLDFVEHSDAPITVETEDHNIGTVREDEPREIDIRVTVPEDAEPGTYDLDIIFRYLFTDSMSGVSENDLSLTDRESLEIEIDDSPRFDLERVDGNQAQIGEVDTVAITVENLGAETASDIEVDIASRSGMLWFGGFEENAAERDTARIDELEPGANTTVTYEVAIDPDAPARTYQLEGTVGYLDEDGVPGQDPARDRTTNRRLTVGVEPKMEQSFRVEPQNTELHVDEEGDVTATVTNEGPITASNVALTLNPDHREVDILGNSVGAGTLEPGEAREVRIPFDVDGQAEAVEKVLDLQVHYRTLDDEARLDDDVSMALQFLDRRDDFDVALADSTIEADSSQLIEVEVTNNRDQRVTDIEAKLGTDDPLDSDDDEGYVAALDSGESTTMTFELAATGDANPKTYAAAIDFRYDDEKGKSKLADTQRLAIDVQESTGPSLLLIGIGVAVLIGGGLLAYRRQSDSELPFP